MGFVAIDHMKVPPKNWAAMDTPKLPFLQKSLMGFCAGVPCECTGQIWSPYSFNCSWDNSDWSFGLRLRTSNLGKWGRRGSGMVPFERAYWRLPIGPPILHSNFSSIFTRFRDIAAFVLQDAIFSHSPQASPKFPHVPMGVNGWPLGYEERRC